MLPSFQSVTAVEPSLKALVHFGDGDLFKLSEVQKAALIEAAANSNLDLPDLKRVSDRLSPEGTSRANDFSNSP